MATRPSFDLSIHAVTDIIVGQVEGGCREIFIKTETSSFTLELFTSKEKKSVEVVFSKKIYPSVEG